MSRTAAILMLLSLACGLAGAAEAQRTEPLPQELEGVGITEHLNTTIPLDLEFVDDAGRPVRLGDYFDGERPVILSLVYFSCPMLCTLVLNGLTDAMQGISWTPGKEFEILTVSFNPAETHTLAGLKKQNYINEYGRPESAAGWHFLTGTEANIQALTKAVGFGYRWIEETQEFSHAAALFVLTPDGRLSRYLYGIQFEPRPVRFALMEASRGKIGSTIDQVIFYCYHYDAEAGTYTLAARRVMQLGGLLTVVILGGWLSAFWIRGGRRKGASPRTPSAA